MIKNLFLSASALVLGATTAQAQTVPQGTPDNVTAVSVTSNLNAPVASATSFRDAISNRSKTATVVSARTVVGQVASQAGVSNLAESGNKSAIDQDGNRNEATVDQQGGWRGWAVVKQDGNRNKASVDQDDAHNSSTGTANAAFVQQIGDDQDAIVNQKEGGAGDLRNSAAIQQGGFAATFTGNDNKARIEQTGTANSANIAQGVNAQVYPSNNYAYVEQVRSTTLGANTGNSASIQQRYAANGAIFQRNATNSQAVIVQTSAYPGTDSDILQTGGSNYAASYQGDDATADSYISQNGDNNAAFVNQSGALSNGISTLFQKGDNNDALVLQTVAPTATSYVSQNGNFNTATVRQ